MIYVWDIIKSHAISRLLPGSLKSVFNWYLNPFSNKLNKKSLHLLEHKTSEQQINTISKTNTKDKNLLKAKRSRLSKKESLKLKYHHV